MKAETSKLSRKEALKVMAAGMSLPFVLSRPKNAFAAESRESVLMSTSGDVDGGTKFVDDYLPSDNERVELINGRIVDVINGRYFELGTGLLIEGKKITAIRGPQRTQRGIVSDFTIDLEGRTVLPALFNTHCHLGMTFPSRLMSLHDMSLTRRYHERQIEKNVSECLAHGITNIRDAWIPDLRTTRTLKEKIERGTIRGPRILQSVVVGPPGGYLTENVGLLGRFMQSLVSFPFVDYEKADSGAVIFPGDANEKQVRDAVNRAVDERGAECIKIGEQLENMVNYKPDATIMTESQLAAIADQARKRNLKTTIHQVSVATFRRAVKCGISSLAHAAFDQKLTVEDVEAFLAAGCIIEPTATVAYDVCWKVKGDPFYDHPEMEKLTQFRGGNYASLTGEYWLPELTGSVNSAYAKVTEGRLKTLGIFDVSGFYKYYSPVIENGAYNLRMLFDMGAPFACGNDGGVPMGTPAMIGHEVSMLDFVLNNDPDAKKLSSIDALKIATINSAKALGLDEEFGSVEAGKTADLAIIEGDPFEDISVIGSRVAALFMDGRLVINNCELETKPGIAYV